MISWLVCVCEGTVTNNPPTPARATAASPRSNAALECSQPKRARKDQGSNWSAQEVMALCNAKRDMFLEEIDTIDPHDLMNAESTKWQRVSQDVMKSGFSTYERDAPACKSKWNSIVPEYKRIADYFARTGTNGADYWNLTAPERKNEGLP